METSFQKIIAAIVGVMIMFIIPVYIAFEKADDVSYSLAVKLTQNFVDNVRNKGYISPDMYSDFVSGLYSTNNAYDVNIEHVKKRYDPVIYIYEKVDEKKGRLLHVLDHDEYIDDYENNSITIDVGIYNIVNSNIEVVSPSITFKDGSYVLDENNQEITDVKKLYEDHIDQYKSQGRIILSRGEIYADARNITGDAFDDDVYIPAIIDDTFKGEIKIVNKQGTEPTELPYELYKNAYFNSTDGIFWGPKYTEESIVYVPALMRLKGVNVSAEESEIMYYERINEYRSEESTGDGRLVFNAGEIYADRAAVNLKHGVFDSKLDMEANISLEEGSFEIKEGSLVSGYEADLNDYERYIDEYKQNGEIVFEGEIYDENNSDIEDLKGMIWKKYTTPDEAAAISLYNDKLNQYRVHDRIVIDEGEIYVTGTEATGYDSLTDKIRSIEVVGNITVEGATGWEPTSLNFNEYINEYRQNGEIEYVKGGTYSAKRNEGYLKTNSGIELDFGANEEQMLNSSGTITVNIDYENQNIIFGTTPIVNVRNTDTNVIMDTKIINEIAEIKNIVDDNSVEINGITYNGDVDVRNKIYSSSIETNYVIEISVPGFMALTDKLDSDIHINGEDDVSQKVYEYIENGKIRIVENFNKSSLQFQRESLEITEAGNTIFVFYHDLNKSKYDEYLGNAILDSEGNVSEITVDPIILSEKLSVKYLQINIGGRSSISINAGNEHYVDDYYDTGRIVLEEAEVWDGSEIEVQHPKLTIYEKGTNIILYEFDGKEETKHEKYEQYVNEYRTSGKITIIPTRRYTSSDIEITPAKIIIEVTDAKNPGTLTFDDNHSKYEDYLNQFITTGKIKLAEPEVYHIDDFEVQDPHIQIKLNGNVIIDVYEKDNKPLYDEYKSQYLDNEAITLKYNIADIYAKRANITIKVLEDKDDLSSIKTVLAPIEDNHANYNDYLNEYENTSRITFEGSLIYNADVLEVKDPSVTITDPDTGSVIVKYEADYSKLDSAERYGIYESRVEEHLLSGQIINEKVTYKNGENCYFEKAHIVNEEVITDKQIVAKLFRDTGISKIEFLRQCMLGNGDMYNSLVYLNENSYVMNEADQINVTVKNRTRTIASAFYSMLTANVGDEEVAKIYVNYGGTVKNDGNAILTEEVGLVTSKTGRLFKYKGQAEEVILSPGEYEIECYGASGGYSSSSSVNLLQVGRGSYAKARFRITEETTLYVYVGGKGTEYSETNEANGGFNGGGNSYNGYGGGGATDVRLKKGEALETSSLLTRIIVAAGGGGNSKDLEGYGGSGGNLAEGINGKTTTPSTTYTYKRLHLASTINQGEGLGAKYDRINVGYSEYMDNRDMTPEFKTISSNEQGTFGIGGSVDFDGAGAGGGGYFGGSAAHDEKAGGGGGVSYVYNVQTSYKDGINYPLTSLVLNNYEDKILEDIKPYINAGKWNGIVNAGASYIDVRNGETSMPDRLTYTGSDSMTGNKGNGYAIIRKVD